MLLGSFMNNLFILKIFLKDTFCQYTLFDDPNVLKTDAIKATNQPDYKYSKQFQYLVNQKVIFNFISTKIILLYIRKTLFN